MEKNTSLDDFKFFSPRKNSAKCHPCLPQKSDFFALNFKHPSDRIVKLGCCADAEHNTQGIDGLRLNFTWMSVSDLLLYSESADILSDMSLESCQIFVFDINDLTVVHTGCTWISPSTKLPAYVSFSWIQTLFETFFWRLVENPSLRVYN